MPAAPRAAVPRKSVVPDPDLYADSDDSDDGDSPRTSTAAAARGSGSGTTGLVRKGSKGPQPPRGSVTTETGRRRSTRLSNEHPQQQQQRRADHVEPRASVAAGKKRAKPESDLHIGRGDHAAGDATATDDRPVSSAAAAAASRGGGESPSAHHRPTSKRPRLDGADSSSRATAKASASAVPSSASAPQPAAAPPPPRRGFIPRAAADLTTRVHKPPPAFSAALVDPAAAEDESAAEPFLFTTNPPTPYAKGANKSEPTRGHPGKEKASRPRPPTRHDSADDADASDTAAARPSSSSRHRRTPPPPSSRQQKPVAPIHVHETPVQVRNIAFRQGLPPGTPATIARSARRSSARGSGKRGSSIGGGFEAVPHPQVADDKLYRSTDASDPIAKRLRSIVSWAAQRTRDRIFRGVRHDEMSAAQAAAKRVVDGFIDDVCSLRVDTSVPYQEPSQSQDPARLPPHPQNESNAAKMQELEDSYAAIAREQELRQSLEPTYQSFFDARTHAHATTSALLSSSASFLPAAARSDPAAYAATLDLSVAAPTSLAEALALGRRVMQGDLVRKDGGKAPATAKKGKGKAGTGEPDETAQDAMQRRVAEAQVDTAAFRHRTHRLLAFTRVAAAYVAHRSAETHAALTRHNELGTAARSTAPPPAGAAAPEGAAGLAGVVPVSGPAATPALTSVTATGAGPANTDAQTRAMDPRDLLRAIAESDSNRRS